MIEVAPDTGAVSSFVSQDNLTTTVEIGPNAVNGPITLVYTELPDPGNGGGNLQLAGRYFRLTAYQDGAPLANFVFNLPIRLVIEYRETDLNGVAEEALELRYYDVSAGEWLTNGIVVEQRDLARNLLTVSIAHLTDFALAGSRGQVYLPMIVR